jgi:hypothetical protein
VGRLCHTGTGGTRACGARHAVARWPPTRAHNDRYGSRDGIAHPYSYCHAHAHANGAYAYLYSHEHTYLPAGDDHARLTADSDEYPDFHVVARLAHAPAHRPDEHADLGADSYRRGNHTACSGHPATTADLGADSYRRGNHTACSGHPATTADRDADAQADRDFQPYAAAHCHAKA